MSRLGISKENILEEGSMDEEVPRFLEEAEAESTGLASLSVCPTQVGSGEYSNVSTNHRFVILV